MKKIFTFLALTLTISACQPKDSETLPIIGGAADTPQTEKSSPYKDMATTALQLATKDCAETFSQIKITIKDAGSQVKFCDNACENPSNFVQADGVYDSNTDTWTIVRNTPFAAKNYSAQILSSDSLVKVQASLDLRDMNDTSTCMYVGQPEELTFPLTIVTDAYSMKGTYKNYPAFTRQCEIELKGACVMVDGIIAYGRGNFGPCARLATQ